MLLTSSHGWAVVVEVRLLLGEDVEVVLPALGVELPGAALEEAVPVVGGLHPAGARAPARPPEVVAAVGALRVAALLEPLVLVGAVVHDEVHENAHPALVRAVEDFFKDFEVAVLGVYVLVIRHVVAEIGVGRGVEGREPDGVHAEALDVVELRQNAPEVAYAVPVPVAEAPRPDLVDDHGLVPIVLSHSISLQAEYTRAGNAFPAPISPTPGRGTLFFAVRARFPAQANSPRLPRRGRRPRRPALTVYASPS